MPSIADMMLAGGCVRHIGAIHGEDIKIISGPMAGRTVFANVIENMQDAVLTTDLGEDRRGKRIIRFADGLVPEVVSQMIIQKADGTKWKAVRAPQDGYLTTDFELLQGVPGKDDWA